MSPAETMISSARPTQVQERPENNSLVIVSGPGRSGTSAITGALSALGIHVPGPHVAANRSNPRGFFETRWVVEFHKALLAMAHTYEFDPDPEAVIRVQTVVDDETRSDLERWLGSESEARSAGQLAIKDPRTVWLHDVWGRAAADHGLDTRYLTTLRHPAQVAASREKYYGQSADAIRARAYAINKVAGWVNVSLLNERQTRLNRRVFIRYTDLISDWRRVLGRVGESLALSFDSDLAPDRAHPIDDFITPSLHHMRTGWGDLDIPGDLRDLADAVWNASDQLAEDQPVGSLDAEFDRLSHQYSQLFSGAAAIASDLRLTAVEVALQKRNGSPPGSSLPLSGPRSLPYRPGPPPSSGARSGSHAEPPARCVGGSRAAPEPGASSSPDQGTM